MKLVDREPRSRNSGRLRRQSVARHALTVCLGVLFAGPSLALAQSTLAILSATDRDQAKVQLSQVADWSSMKSSQSGMFLGGLSCDSASCHGSARRETALGSAAHFFLERDKHQLAGKVLREQRSLNIAKRLNLPEPAWETRECLVCHAPAAIHVTDRNEFKERLSEGVGCESCHGPARNWLSPHHSAEWRRSNIWSDYRKEQAGFRETKQLLTRVNVCADCHVGNEKQSVTHDFIAAGHPRLAFEYAAYQSKMPVHWKRSDDRKRSNVANTELSSDRSTYEGKNWLIGQLVNADHDLRILSAAARDTERVWPELAQYDCFGCHHELSSPNWRQVRTAWNLQPGELQWETWNLGLIAETQSSLPSIVSKQTAEDLDALCRAMRSTSISRIEAMHLIDNLQPKLAIAMLECEKASLTAEALGAIRDSLLNDYEPMTNQGWDRSVQLFLATIALDKGINDASGLGNLTDPARREFFTKLRDMLSYRGPTKPDPLYEYRQSPRLSVENWWEIRQNFQQLSSLRSSSSPASGAGVLRGSGNLPTEPKPEIE